MARLFAAPDSITIPQLASTGGCLSFRMRTTQTTANVELVSHHDASASRAGYGVVLNATAGKLTIYGKEGVAAIQRFSLTGTTTVNDGAWHHIGINFWYATLTNGQQLYVDGNLDVQGSSSGGGNWGGSTQPFRLGKSNDTFWAGYVGELAEVAVWAGGGETLAMTADQFKALAKGFAPDAVCKGGSTGLLHIDMPLVRGVQCLVSEQGTPTVSGTSVSDHPRMIGSRGP